MMEDSKRRRILDDLNVKLLLVNLPLEILWNILFRLPIESILSCKSVCKALYALIRNPSFETRHHQRRKDRTSSYLVLSDNRMFLMDETRTSLRELSLRKIQIPLAFEYRFPYPKIVAAFDGLICIASVTKQDPVFLCNPITSECIILPMSQLRLRHQFYSCVGLGLDPVSGQYKVVRGYKRMFCMEWICNFQILTLGDVSWREMEYPGDVYLDAAGAGVYWNGAIHWTGKTGRYDADCIIAVDLNRERIHVISFPGTYEEWYPHSTRLAVLQGRLCMVEQKKQRMKIWEVSGDEMEGYSIEHKITYDTSARWNTAFDDYKIISQLDVETILLQVHCRSYPGTRKEWIVEFNTETGHYTFQDILSFCDRFEAIEFEPSLISPLQPQFPTLPTASMEDLIRLVCRDWEWGPSYPYFKPGARAFT